MGIGIIITLVLLSILIVTLVYIIFNLLRKNEIQEDILAEYLIKLNQISITIAESDKILKTIDERGTFKSDDEVGYFFKSLQDIQEILNLFQVKTIEEPPQNQS